MAAGTFRVGHRFVQNDHLHRVARNLGGGVLAIENLSTGRVKEQSVAELLDAWRSGALVLGDRPPPAPEAAVYEAIRQANSDAFVQSYSEVQQDRAKAKLAYVTRLESLPRSESVMRPVIEEIWADKKLWKDTFAFDKPPHFTTVAHWIRSYQDADRDIRALVDRHRDKGNKEERYHPIVVTMIDDLITTRYLTLERPTLQAILEDLKGMVARENATRLRTEQLTKPTYGYLKRRVAALAPYDVCKARFGQRVADIKFRVAGSNTLAQRPLARACMDHSRMDVFVIDELTGLPLGRPWLTIVIDEFSRYVLGYYLSFEEPSSVSMTRALRHALSPKEASSDSKCLWDAWGIMEVLVVDNGMEFHTRALEAGAGRFGITVQFCPRRKPWYKGKVERFFGTINTGLLVDMKGKTFSSVLLKGDYDPSKHAVMTLNTLRRVLHTWIVDIYHQEDHGGLDDRTPAMVWGEAMAGVDRFLPPSSLALETAFSKSDKRRLTHKGIELDSLFYNSADLGALRRRHGHEFDVEVRSYDDDLGSIVVVAPDGKTLVKVPAVNRDYADGLTRWQHRVCKRYQARVHSDDSRHISLLEARERIRQLIAQDMALASRKTRKSQQRFLQNEPPTSEATPAAQPADAPLSKATENAPPPAPAAISAKQPTVLKSRLAQKLAADDDNDMPTFSSRKVAGGTQ